jgi:CubicO group peptidase (beta-lactamase class C family)
MTKLQFRVLYREFLSRMVDLELLSAHAQGDASTLLGQFAALLIFLSLLFSIPALGFGDSRIPPQANLIFAWSAEHFLIATTMLVVGLFAVLSWDSTFPDRRDVLTLGPLPVRARTLFLAKVAAVAASLSLTVVTLHVLAGLVWPLALNARFPACSIPAFTSDRAMAPVEAAGLQSVLDRDLARVLAPGSGELAPGTGAGIAIGVVEHGVRRVFTYGAAKPDSLFEIGSVTKTFTGLVLAQMVEQGTVRLDEPVRELLPAGTVAKPSGAEITLLDLATQHSGLPRMPRNFHPADKTNPYASYHVSDLYAFVADYGVRKPANATFAYSNLGFGLLGQALADRARMTYADLAKEQVTRPLGMRDTVVSLSAEQQSRFMQGHDVEHHPVHAWDVDGLAGAGAIRSTAGDMLTYLDANLHPEKLTATLSAAMVRSHELKADAGGPGGRIALAWFQDTNTGVYWHGGATAGYTADAFFKPKGDYAAIVLSNTGLGTIISADIIGDHIRSRLAGKSAISLAKVSVPASGGIRGAIRLFAVYWITMLAAGAFIFCCVLGVQGLAAQLLPRRLFLRVSSFLQMAAFCLFVCVYFLQPMLAMPSTLIAAQNHGLLAWSPSYWFLGLFQELNGSPALAPLARRAWIGLAVAGCGTAVAYALSYFRTLRKIVEEPDIVPGGGGARWLPRFGTSLQTAIVQFSIRTLLRSRRHRVILAFYLGIGFAITIFFMKSPRAQEISASAAVDPWRQASTPLLASSIMMMGFCVVGTRVVFSMPLDLPANWIFRVTPVCGGPECFAARRRAMVVLAVAPLWVGSAALFLSIWPWRAAVGHLVVLGLEGLILSELCLHGTQKIPFTCSWLPGKSNVHITFWLCVGLLVSLIAKGAEFERQALEDPARCVTMIVILGVVAVCVRLRTFVLAEETGLEFEEVPSWQMVTLELPRDGGLRTDSAASRPPGF